MLSIGEDDNNKAVQKKNIKIIGWEQNWQHLIESKTYLTVCVNQMCLSVTNVYLILSW